MKTSFILFDRVDMFNTIFNADLKEIGYTESKLILDRLECSGKEFPSIPVAESIWINNMSYIEFVFRTYENYITDFEIFDKINDRSLSINNFKVNLKISNIEIHLMSGNINQKYCDYLSATLDFIKSSDIWEVLTNKKWVEVPFNWQGQK
jgi:hypothetical protein